MFVVLVLGVAMDTRRVAVEADGTLVAGVPDRGLRDAEHALLAVQGARHVYDARAEAQRDFDLRRDAQAADAESYPPADPTAGLHLPPIPDELKAPAIPDQLFLSAKYRSLDELPPSVRGNIDRIVNMNNNIEIVFFDDAKCIEFLEKDNAVLADLFKKVTHGAFKSDICRTAWLAENGGWYIDLDIDMRLPFHKMVKPETTFFSAWSSSEEHGGADILNALIGVAPGCPVMKEAVHWLGTADAAMGCQAPDGVSCGTKALKKGLRDFSFRCGVAPPTRRDGPLDMKACDQELRLAKEIDLADPLQRSEANVNDPRIAELAIEGRNVTNFRGRTNAEKHFKGLNYAIVYTGSPSMVLGYSRFDGCDSWGCQQNPVPNLPSKTESRPAKPVVDEMDAAVDTQGSREPRSAAGRSPLLTSASGEKPKAAKAPWYSFFFPTASFAEQFSWAESHTKWY